MKIVPTPTTILCQRCTQPCSRGCARGPDVFTVSKHCSTDTARLPGEMVAARTVGTWRSERKLGKAPSRDRSGFEEVSLNKSEGKATKHKILFSIA